jgi:hypothetical protein
MGECTMRITDVAHTLREAAEYIGEHGWLQGTLSSADGRVCAIGAIQRIGGTGNARSYDAVDALYEYLDLPMTTGILHPVAIWNDEPERTAEDVILAMKCAAEELDSEGK